MAHRGLDESETLVGLAGDWECDSVWARRAFGVLAEHGVTSLFHLGDLSVLPDPRARQFLSEVEGACRHHGITIYLTPGNHEDHGWLASLSVGPDGLAWVADHLAVLPRGHRWTMAGKTFVSLGGAPSVDYPRRSQGVTWWPEEMITVSDIQRVADGGPADVMLAHDAPRPATPAVNRIVGGDAGMAWTERGLRYAALGRERITEAFQAVQPALYAHGHYDVHDEALLHPDGWDHLCQMLSFAAAGHIGNLALLDLQDGRTAVDDGNPSIRYTWL